MAFLSLECREAFYGGACGGGKSDALLMWALEGVDTPGYAAVLLRRTYPQLSLAGGFIPRSMQWLAGTSAKWNGTAHTWTFPSGATLSLMAMQHEKDMYNFQGGQFHRVGIDELTHFSEMQYLWMNSRLRRDVGFPWVPQIRSGANPGGVGHLWVKNRFVTQESMDAISLGEKGVYWNDDRAFVPARLDDNQHLEREEYRAELEKFPPVMRERLLNGDWSVVEDALISAEWLSYYEMRGQILCGLDSHGQKIQHGQIDDRECRRFATVDTAGTTKQKEAERKGKPSSWSVCAVWDYWPKQKWLFLRHVWRARVGFRELCDCIERLHKEWAPQRIHVENAHLGPAVIDTLRGKVPVCAINPVTAFMKGKSGMPGKVERATPLLNKLDRGEIFLPAGNNDWLPDLEAEWLSWMGLKDEQSDQIDVASYAATIVYDWKSTTISRSAVSMGTRPGWQNSRI